MSWKSNFTDGIVLNTEHNGLLTVVEDRLINIIKKEPITNVYHVEQTPFARGKFAAVRKCTHQQTGVEYAAKFIRKRRRAMDQRQDIVHEVAVLQLAADSPFIVSLHEVYETSSEVALVLELASGGELQTVLDVQEGLQENEAVLVMRQIMEGLGFLHDRNIAHLDLKPQNLLLTGAYPECDIKLCDFGISRVIQGGVEVREILGTPDYVAPEILSYEPISLATDIWSVGVLAYVLLSGFSPFGGENKQETFLNISQCSLTFPSELFEGVSSQAKDFIRATLQMEPKKRLTSRQCLQHPWLNPTALIPRTPEEQPDSFETLGKSGVVCAIMNGSGVLSELELSSEISVKNDVKKEVICISRSEDDTTINGVNGLEIVAVTQKLHHKINLKTEDMNDSEIAVIRCTTRPERSSVGDTINGLKISKVSLECSQSTNDKVIAEYKERRMVIMSQDRLDGQEFSGPNGRTDRESPESDEDLPVHKRPKNCDHNCSFPHCCHLPMSPVENIHNGVANTTVERPLIC